MVLLNPAANRGHSGQEIRSDLHAEIAARLNNPSPEQRVAKVAEDYGTSPASLRSRPKYETLRESVDAIRARLTADVERMHARLEEIRDESSLTYTETGRLREDDVHRGEILDELG